MHNVTFEVELNMFGQGKIRKVIVPMHELWDKTYSVARGCTYSEENVRHDLGLIFKYGQNEVQPRPLPSVSMGDVIRWSGDRYLILALGYRLLREGDVTVGYIPQR